MRKLKFIEPKRLLEMTKIFTDSGKVRIQIHGSDYKSRVLVFTTAAKSQRWLGFDHEDNSNDDDGDGVGAGGRDDDSDGLMR